ncbi:hypothetical protein AAH088_15975 [Bacteroides hominis]|uniref:hypothetical protein n=1 Tax=Bacteroides sp. TaxID=29523 RepID=UPI002A838B42|nr:hypothetical protein [Bacteroides sp.]
MKTATARKKAKPRTKVMARMKPQAPSSPRHREHLRHHRQRPLYPTASPTPPATRLPFRPSGKEAPHLNQPPVSFSIKDAMNSLGSKLVIGGIPKPGNKDDPDTAHTNKPKSFKL